MDEAIRQFYLASNGEPLDPVAVWRENGTTYLVVRDDSCLVVMVPADDLGSYKPTTHLWEGAQGALAAAAGIINS